MSYDNWKTTEPEERATAPDCDCCGERPATRIVRGLYGIETTSVCDACSNQPPECDVCGGAAPEGYSTILGAPICLSCWEESDDGVAFRAGRRTFQASFAGSR